MLLDRILQNALPGESGAARLQQVGLFTLVYMMQGDDEPVTARRLAEITGQGEGHIGQQLRKLIGLDLLERTQIPNRQGRGRAFKLTVKQNGKTRRLTKAIEKGARSRK